MKIIFESEHIIYTKIYKSFVKDYLNMLNDYENVGKYISKDNITTLEEELEWIDKKKKEKSTMYTMVDKSTNKFIGTIGISSTNNELGISISKDFQDKGYGTEAVNRITEYGFNILNLNRIFLKTNLSNSRAFHVYSKCGYKEFDRDDLHIFMEIYKK